MKKILSIILVILTLISILPVSVFAASSSDTTSGIPFPEKYYTKTCPKTGKVTQYYLDGNKDRSVYIWTPYNYNKNTKYEIVVLLHGKGDKAGAWLKTSHSVWNGKKITGQNIFDWMAYDKVCKPFIVVTFNSGYSSLISKNEILKVIKIAINNYSTYAKNDKDASVKAIRNHIILGGLSKGAGNAYEYTSKYPQYIGNLICMSGSRSLSALKKALKSNKLNKLFIACGKNDKDYYSGCHNYYNKLASYTNSRKFVGYKSMGHDWKTWYSGVYDGLKFIIPN